MNSKKALDNLVHCKSITRCKECRHKSLCTMERDFNIIKQDLDRLEQLEKEHEKLKERYKHRAETSNDLCKAVKQYEKVIDILKDELEISFEDTTQEGNGYWVVLKNWSGAEEVVIHFNTPNNYELLKEVLDNAKN